MLLHPTSKLPNDTPIKQVRFTWEMRRALIDAGLTTVGAVREAADETLLGLKMTRGLADHIRSSLG